MKHLAVLALVLVAASLSGCAVLGKVDGALLSAHSEAVADIAAENSRYVTADPALAESQRAIRLQRNKDTAAFAKSLAEAK